MNIKTLFTSCAILAASLNCVSAQGGSLTPPPGVPAPTMRALDEVEPRIPITELPYTISESGSYIVTGPLASTGHGIFVQAHNVTIDLMGFTISGNSQANFHGILAQGGEGIPLRNVHIRNGGVQNFGDGVRFENVNGGSIQHLTAIQNVGRGMNMRSLSAPGNTSANVIIEHCLVIDNGNVGIGLDGNAGNARGFVIRHNSIQGNLGMGIRIDRGEGCVVTDNMIGPQVPDINDFAYAIFNNQTVRSLFVRNISIDNATGMALAGVRGFIIAKQFGNLSDTGIESHPMANFHIRND